MIDTAALSKKYPAFQSRKATKAPVYIQPPMTAEQALARVCKAYGVTHGEIIGQDKTRKVSEARNTAYVALFELQGRVGPLLTTTEIAAIFGRDRSTIIKGLQRAGAWPPARTREAA